MYYTHDEHLAGLDLVEVRSGRAPGEGVAYIAWAGVHDPCPLVPKYAAPVAMYLCTYTSLPPVAGKVQRYKTWAPSKTSPVQWKACGAPPSDFFWLVWVKTSRGASTGAETNSASTHQALRTRRAGVARGVGLARWWTETGWTWTASSLNSTRQGGVEMRGRQLVTATELNHHSIRAASGFARGLPTETVSFTPCALPPPPRWPVFVLDS